MSMFLHAADADADADVNRAMTMPWCSSNSLA